MEKNSEKYKLYLDILRSELVPAMGCTEPIAISYAAAVARAYLEKMPDKITVEVSGNIIKNVKSVIVPNTGGLKGIEAAAAAGIIAGRPELLLDPGISEQALHRGEACGFRTGSGYHHQSRGAVGQSNCACGQ